MSAEVVFSATDFDEGERADVFICSGLEDLSRSAVQKLQPGEFLDLSEALCKEP